MPRPLRAANGTGGGRHLSQDIYETIINCLLGSLVIHSLVLPFLPCDCLHVSLLSLLPEVFCLNQFSSAIGCRLHTKAYIRLGPMGPGVTDSQCDAFPDIVNHIGDKALLG